MERDGLKVSEQTLFEQTLAVAKHLEPVKDSILEWLLEQPAIHIDETTWKLAHKKRIEKGYFWVISSGGRSWFHYAPSRGAKVLLPILKGYTGVVICDGYQAYKSLQAACLKTNQVTFIQAGCWAHARRKFFHAQSSDPKQAKPILKLIDALFRVERQAVKAARDGPEILYSQRLLEQRQLLREKYSRHIMASIKERLMQVRALPKSDLGKANAYLVNQWRQLAVFLDFPEAALSNNEVERAIRGPVVGRKNYYCNRSPRGICTATTLYSVFETAKALGLNEYTYALEAIRYSIRGKVPLLPWAFAPTTE